MSNNFDANMQPSDQSIALFLQENEPDALTDILVEALSEALRILEDDLRAETLH